MRAIYKIARLELSNLFCSPVAWILMVIFVFMTGMTFCDRLEIFARSQELGNAYLRNLSELLFFYPDRFWYQVSKWFYLLLPLLTMGLVSQEFSRGSVKLLFSAPITARHIVLGKYLGIMLYGLILITFMMIVVIVAGIVVDSFDWTAVLTGLLGLYLQFGLYAAIGLFMSTLTNYPIVSAIGMFVLLAFLELVSGVWQEYTFMREVTYWLSLSGRVNTFINGLICSEDVLYFIIMTLLFLSFAVLKLELLRESISFFKKMARYLGIFVVAMLLGYLTSRPVFKIYYDATHTQKNTLTQVSQDIMSKLDGGLKLTTFVNLFDGEIYTITTDKVKKDIARYQQYIRFKPEMKMDYVFYYSGVDTTSQVFKLRFPNKSLYEAAKDVAKLLGTRLGKYLTPEEIKKIETEKGINLSDEGYRYLTLIERENGEKTVLRVFDDFMKLPFETEITTAMKRVAMKLPKVGFLSDHQARSMWGDKNRDYSYMVAEKKYRNALINQGFEVLDISLQNDEQTLDSLDILVVAEPLEPFTERDLKLLYRYIDSGKNLLLAGKPKTASNLEPLMNYLGLCFEPGILVQKPVEEYPAHILLCTVTEEAKELTRWWEELYKTTHKPNRLTSLVMPEAAAIKQVEDKGFQLIPLLKTRDSISWNEVETVDFVNETAMLNPKVGEQAEVKITMLALKRQQEGRDQRIIVSGDAASFCMGEMTMNRRGIKSANSSLIMSMFNWFSYEELPVFIERLAPQDNELHLSLKAAETLQLILQWILPALILFLGTIILIRRKGK